MERIGEQKREDVVAEKDSEMERVVKSTAEKDSEMEKAVRMMKRETKMETKKEDGEDGGEGDGKRDREKDRDGDGAGEQNKKSFSSPTTGGQKNVHRTICAPPLRSRYHKKYKFSIKKSSDHTKNIFFDAIKTTIDYVWKKSFKCHSTGSSKQRTSMGTG